MGGHRAGDIASRMATVRGESGLLRCHDSTATGSRLGPASDDGCQAHAGPEQNRLVSAVKLANHRIFQASLRNRSVQGMGTTIVGALFERAEQKIHIAHVGDSRAYCVRDGKPLRSSPAITRCLNDYLLVMPNLSDAQKQNGSRAT